MFCNRCGTEMLPQYVACPKCGRKVGDPIRDLAYSRLDGHLHTLGFLWIIVGALFAIPAAALLIFWSAAHLVMRGAEPLAGLFPVLVYVAGSMLVVLAAGGICVGVGLRQRRPWARIGAIILGALALLHPPLGTALGVYTLWVLLADEGGEEYEYLSRTT